MRQTEVQWSLEGVEWIPASDTATAGPRGDRRWDERARLVATAVLSGVPFRAEAFQVRDGEPVDSAADETLDWLSTLRGANQDRPFRTIEIEGRDYVLVITPFSR